MRGKERVSNARVTNGTLPAIVRKVRGVRVRVIMIIIIMMAVVVVVVVVVVV